MRLPYFRWYPADAEADDKYSAMDEAELGFFHRCLNKSWTNGGIPADPDERARVMKIPRKRADALWVRVGKSFEPMPEDASRLVNPRLEAERAHAESKSEKASNAVRMREERRSSDESDDGSDDESNDHPRVRARAESEYEYSSLRKKSAEKKPEIETWFESEFWPAYPRKVGKASALKAARTQAKSESVRAEIMSGLVAQSPELKSREIQFIPHPGTWLGQQRWKDAPEPVTMASRNGTPKYKPWAECTPEERMELPTHMIPGLVGGDDY